MIIATNYQTIYYQSPLSLQSRYSQYETEKEALFSFWEKDLVYIGPNAQFNDRH